MFDERKAQVQVLSELLNFVRAQKGNYPTWQILQAPETFCDACQNFQENQIAPGTGAPRC